nr:hypothetical protein [Thiosulfatihalobacter marinus]
MTEHCFCQRHKLFGRLKGFDHRADIALDLFTSDGFAIAGTALGLAEIIGVGLATTGAVGRPKGRTAIGTADKATQGEIVSDILAHGGLGDAAQALLHFLEGLNGDQRVVMSFEPIDAVVF